MKQILLIIILFGNLVALAQAVPAKDENIPYLVTFGNESSTSFGDDDYTQVFFFSFKEDFKKPVYIRVFDPEVGGAADEEISGFNTKTKFSIYGGKGCITNKDARSIDPVGRFNSGNLLASKVFGEDEKYDQKWYTFGPFNPTEGEYSEKYGGYVFKVISQGISGNDGNLYRYFLSTSPDENIEVEGGNAFTFEYTFRLHNNPREVSHIYPYIDNEVVSIKQTNFDWDSDGLMLLTSVATLNHKLTTSGDNTKVTSEYIIQEGEKGGSLDIKFKKSPLRPANNNNVVLHITNQYGEFLPFYTIPIGGVPQYKGGAAGGAATGVKKPF